VVGSEPACPEQLAALPGEAVGSLPPVLSVVMPAYNEAALLARSVEDVLHGLKARGAPFEILVVENGSTDGTAPITDALAARHPGVRSIHLAVPDYGAALRTGLLAASGETVVNFDVDYYDLGFVDTALIRMAQADTPAIVVGSKRASGAEDRRAWTRRVVTWGFSAALRVLFGLGVSDTHGMKALRREAVVGLAEQCRFGHDLFDTELILRAERSGLNVVEVPVVVVERRPSRSRIWARIPRSLVGLVRLHLRLRREALLSATRR
jgi:glycosyltransferase involved in cell wall biosynthesis